MSNNNNENNLPAIDSEQEKVLFEQLSGSYTENRDIANQLLGRVQMAQGIAKLTSVVSLVDLQKIKEGKLYKAIKGQDVTLADGTKVTSLGTWEDFCKCIGESKSKVDEELLNLREFGEQALNQLKKVGISVHNLRAIRQLPAEEQQAVLESEAVEVNDKEAVQELIDELKEAHKKETSTLNHQNLELRNNIDVKSKMNDRLSNEMMQLKEELAKHDFKADNWQNTTKQALLEAISYETAAMEALNKLSVYRQFIFESEDLTDASRQYLAGGLLDASKQLAEDFALFWTDSSSMLAAYLPHIRPSIEALEELTAQALENGKG